MEKSTTLLFKMMSVLLWASSTQAAVSLDLEEQFHQLHDNYDKVVAELKEKDQQNKALTAKVNQLEIKLQQQESLTMSTQSEPSAGHNSTKVLRQATVKVPTSCLDVYINGQTTNMATPLSGIYLIMGPKFVETVFCDFTKLITDPSSQRWIGYADIKSAPIYFYVQRNHPFTATNIPIPFQIERVNIGGAMDLPSGKFTAPRDGTYFFSFAGLAQFPNSTNEVYLKIAFYSNGAYVGTSECAETNTASGHSNMLALQLTLNLQKGVQVWLQIWAITAGVSLWDSRYNHTHFTGWILQEEIANSLL